MATQHPTSQQKLNRLAILIAVAPPSRRTQHARHAEVPWELITLLREVLDESGYNWRKVKQLIPSRKSTGGAA
jgi:hypothetical protein